MRTRFNVLGPLELRRAGVTIPLRSTKQRSLLAQLIIHANEVVTVGALIEAVWSGRPPATAHAVLQTYVSQVRRTLEPGAAPGSAALRTIAPGYRLDVDPEDVDAQRFERLAEIGCEHLRRGEMAAAFSVLRHAESLWRGPAFADLGGVLAVAGEVERLEALRLMTVEARIEAATALGHPAGGLIAELEALLLVHPFRERTWAQLMRCLYRDGRQADALDAYQRLRRLLGDELGLTPTPAVAALERDILAHCPNLAPTGLLGPGDPGSAAHTGGGALPRALGTTPIGWRRDAQPVTGRPVRTERRVTIFEPAEVRNEPAATEIVIRSSEPVIVVRLGPAAGTAGAVAVLAGAADVDLVSGPELLAAASDVLRCAGAAWRSASTCSTPPR
jgi:DNA-binding SARP family transcriptional activator